MPTRKHLEKLSLRLQPGLLQSATEIFGGSASAQTLTSVNQIAYDTESFTQDNELDDDRSIEGSAFENLGNQTGLKAQGEVTGPLRYDGLEPLILAMMGFERPTGSTDDAGFSPESVGGSLFSHLFELDAHDRHNAAYRTTFDLDGITQASISFDASDRKDRAVTIGLARDPNDHRYKDSMIQSFGFSGTPDDKIIKWTMSVVGEQEERADFDSDNWDFAPGNGPAKNVLFKDLTAKLGNLASRAVVDLAGFNITVEVPLLIEQTSESDSFITEPFLQDKYKVTLELTVARHDADTFRAALEANTEQACSLEFSSGSNTFKFLFESMRLMTSPLGDEGVARQVLTFMCGPLPSGGTDFSSELGNHVLKMGGPFSIQNTSQNADNWLRKE